ncbi:lipopolysaccharide biosynthesis protein [Flavobacterium caseinilyticum]|uniref:Lipopolysaccharide biosynthesis protein n=2 Tax=Flavobacterium caseinilyticum TaxID=2541732 RepID=A0A4R5AWX5_9FLAO|nr:lipopolysaccharide biosynthesis protein [Flavobacterium caseinilyticum]
MFLYIRMIITMVVSLYTSRVVLNTLGIEDYGIYIIIGGVVTLFSFFNSAMSSATQRFLAFDIGTNDEVKLKQTFNATLNIHIGIAILVLILAETIGLWFVNYKLNVPIEKMNAINWVYQFSIFALLVGVVQVPYNALIIARERMNIYAIFSIVEVSLKLFILYLLIVSPFDKLKTYAVLMFFVTILIAIFYTYYCKRNFTESIYKFFYEKQLYKILISYSGWNIFGNIAAVARGQGINILLNLFFGTVLNAAFGITLQVQGAVQVFVANFQMAVNPQIIKNYANGNTKQSLNLIFQSAKFSYFLLFLIVCPILFSIDFILKIWLINPPKYTAIFVTLALINLLIDSVSGPLMTGIQATGKIKWYQIVIGSFIFLNLPIAYVLLKIYNKPELVFFSSIIISCISFLFRLYYVRNSLKLSVIDFFKQVVSKIFVVSFIVLVMILFFNRIDVSLSEFQIVMIRSFYIIIITIIAISLFGISKNERLFIKQFIFNKISK